MPVVIEVVSIITRAEVRLLFLLFRFFVFVCGGCVAARVTFRWQLLLVLPSGGNTKKMAATKSTCYRFYLVGEGGQNRVPQPRRHFAGATCVGGGFRRVRRALERHEHVHVERGQVEGFVFARQRAGAAARPELLLPPPPPGKMKKKTRARAT